MRIKYSRGAERQRPAQHSELTLDPLLAAGSVVGRSITTGEVRHGSAVVAESKWHRRFNQPADVMPTQRLNELIGSVTQCGAGQVKSRGFAVE